MHRKSRQDAKRGAVFSKMGKEILAAARAGGGDPDANGRLRLAIEHARDAGVPAENIERAIRRGSGEGADGSQLEELIYEGYGAGGVAVLLEILTDNRNRTAGEVRYLFNKYGGNLGETGCVAWMFEKKGLLVVDRSASELSEEDVLERALDSGAEDVRTDDETFEVVTAPEDFVRVKEQMEGTGLQFAEAELAMLPKSEVQVQGKEAEQLLRLIEALDEHDDVQAVHANHAIDEELLASFGE